MSKYCYLICLAVFILAGSCANEKKKTQTTERMPPNSVQYEWVNKQILFPGDSILPRINSPKDLSNLLSENSYKIVNYLDAGCSSCVYELNQTQEFSNGLAKHMAVPFIIIMTGAPKANIDYIVTDQAHLSLPVFYDKDGTFFTMNNLPANKVYQTFLLDKENKVVFAGSPIKEPSFVATYEQIIDSIQSIHN